MDDALFITLFFGCIGLGTGLLSTGLLHRAFTVKRNRVTSLVSGLLLAALSVFTFCTLYALFFPPK